MKLLDNCLKLLNCDVYQRALASMAHKFLDKKTGSEISVNEQLAEKIHKPVIKKFKRRKLYARFKGNIWAADLAEMDSLSSKNKNVKYLLCAIDVFTKYAWVKHLKIKKGKTVLNAFIKIVNESNCQPNKLWVDQGRKFYNKLMQEWLDINDILTYSTHNGSKSAIAERIIKTLKSEIYKKMTANNSKSYFPYLNKLVDQYNNTDHHSIRKKAINANYSASTENIESNFKAPKFKLNDRVRTTKYKNIFSKGYTEKWSREIFIIDSALKTNPWTYKVKDLDREKIIGSFYGKELLRSVL